MRGAWPGAWVRVLIATRPVRVSHTKGLTTGGPRASTLCWQNFPPQIGCHASSELGRTQNPPPFYPESPRCSGVLPPPSPACLLARTQRGLGPDARGVQGGAGGPGLSALPAPGPHAWGVVGFVPAPPGRGEPGGPVAKRELRLPAAPSRVVTAVHVLKRAFRQRPGRRRMTAPLTAS